MQPINRRINEKKIFKGKQHHESNRKYRSIVQLKSQNVSADSSEVPDLSVTKKLNPSAEEYLPLHHFKKEEFPFYPNDFRGNESDSDDIVEVVVQYFDENPTDTCWVIQRKNVDRRDEIMKLMNFDRSFDVIDVGQVRLNQIYCVLFEGLYYRCVVLHFIDFLKVFVRLIDNGRTLQTRVGALSPLRHIPSNLNGFAFEINFGKMRRIEIDEVLLVEMLSTNLDGVINVRLMDEKIFTYDDMESTPLPTNVPIEMFCLDHSNVDKGFISACQNDSHKIESINGISDKIAQYQMKNVESYCPKVNELCLAYFEGDNQWYRARCLKEINANTFKLVMIDYGCVRSVISKHIRKMVKEFMEPTIMQLCAIDGMLFFKFVFIDSHFS